MEKLFFVILSFWLGFSYAQNTRSNFPDVLKLGYQVQRPNRIETNVFADLGAWHAYTLPSDSGDYGSFIGPLVMDMSGQWLANSIAKLSVKEMGKVIDLKKGKIAQHYYPGMLEQEVQAAKLRIILRLIYVSSTEVMVQTQIENLSSQRRKLELSWSGQVLLKDAELKKDKNGIAVLFDKDHVFRLNFSGQKDIQILNGAYQASQLPVRLTAGSIYRTVYTQCYHPEQTLSVFSAQPKDFKKALQANQLRWNHYLDQYFNASGKKIKDPIRRRIAVKSMVTLISNWRTRAKDLLHDGVFPSLNYQGFYGFWSWDSWKQAVGISYFNPELAKSNILSMFDYQDEYGMVADCIYTDKSENNWRDTKPPLAAWSVWKIQEHAPDPGFLKHIYPMLVKYHQWWYMNRDHNQNGLCEYGSTDGTRIAAAWESGMDNAVRFDQARLLKNNDSAWSLNQESVDLNAYLYAEKGYLAQIAAAIGLAEEARQWEGGKELLRKKINETFYQADKGYYHDKLLDGQWMEAEGPEAWIPLWCGIADSVQAEAVLKVMLDKHKFNTFVPLPTLAADHPRFDPLKGYWRGPVWLDQIYFGLTGLQLYGYKKESACFLEQLLRNAEGLSTQGPIRENYHPISGKGLNAMNFSWSAAHLLMLLKENKL
ncbi:glycoside hydrolase [Pedobacter sp. HMWF019]|uniref:MGH1-like glycoside hydrolase domain-containing protein n=1 Tax=Pedobacter sp. HMWF019 TaxID=2056856 RepID=UPI000D3CD01F|nr:trehalase family glycosidase [Pedobacter sp. HMWF019]PTT04158.1 glycoside hydrolase [Pedobacter sp. HMWF019]